MEVAHLQCPQHYWTDTKTTHEGDILFLLRNIHNLSLFFHSLVGYKISPLHQANKTRIILILIYCCSFTLLLTHVTNAVVCHFYLVSYVKNYPHAFWQTRNKFGIMFKPQYWFKQPKRNYVRADYLYLRKKRHIQHTVYFCWNSVWHTLTHFFFRNDYLCNDYKQSIVVFTNNIFHTNCGVRR